MTYQINLNPEIPDPSSITQESFYKRNLRGAICEYLDENKKLELYEDLLSILEEERDLFMKKSSFYAEVISELFPEAVKAAKHFDIDSASFVN